MANLLKYKFHALFVVIFIALSVYLYSKHISKYPISTHAWAQSDRYAIAEGFLHNGFNLFQPETYLLNLPDKPKKELTNPQGITQVDMPIHEFLVAVFVKIFSSQTAFTFRLYTLGYSLIGLFFLFLLFYEQNSSFLKSLVVVAFACTSPVYVYYQIGFLPSIPSIANVFIGYYFFIKYQNNLKYSYLIVACTFFTFAMLNRLPLGIFFIATFCQQLYSSILVKRFKSKEFFVFLSGFLLVGLYFAYNQFLKANYGSLFLTKALPVSSFTEAQEIWESIKQYTLKQYYTDSHYVSLIIAGILFFVSKYKIKQKLTSFQKLMFVNISISFIGTILYSFLMFKQFKHHDYYFLDSLFIPFVLLFGILISCIELKSKTLNIVGFIIAITIILVWFDKAKYAVDGRFKLYDYDKISYATLEIKDSYKTLDSLKIPNNATIFILDDNSLSNIELIHFKRKGYSFPLAVTDGTAREKILNADYTITINKLFTKQLDSNYRVTLNQLDTFFVNEKLTIYKKP